MIASQHRPSLFLSTLPHFLEASTCNQIIETASRRGFEFATVRTREGPVMRTDIRNNERVLFDDADLRKGLFDRLLPHLPASLHDDQPLGLADTFKLYKYGPGQRFKPHKDGFLTQEGVRTQLTCLIYLNADMAGGETTFFADDRIDGVRPIVHTIQPETGLAVIFEHPWWHEGKEVIEGLKYVLRTDVLYGQPDY